MIEIKDRRTGAVLYRSEKNTVREALAEWHAMPEKERPSLRYSDLSYSDLSYSDLSYSNLRYSNLTGTGCLHLQGGQWNVWITPDTCRVGCQEHPHVVWQSLEAEQAAYWHPDGPAWWEQWGAVVLAGIAACAKHGWPKTQGEQNEQA